MSKRRTIYPWKLESVPYFLFSHMAYIYFAIAVAVTRRTPSLWLIILFPLQPFGLVPLPTETAAGNDAAATQRGGAQPPPLI